MASLSSPEVARYQREAATGLRATEGSSATQASDMPLPSTERSGSAKVWNARKTTIQRQARKAAVQPRKLKVLEAKAFETLGLSSDASADEIRQRYKQRLKMYHPDVNQGDRDAEAELQAAIEAHRILKLNGFC
jgi:DnaJ-domain-containing protein 1